ncbi:hypothetical protein TD95_000800 [Thielaviopsis punctulata]|uniref:Rab proteins geranylgeranyltransferase n=1 Tax=Thielaviopsis punctulata TaxID=72032 RepID=A0A0F4ZMZ9_9PEZI|nr:hypothetical protein TD95_000800 [Thielaviopsis punctulata]
MESLADELWDVVINGTGLQQSLLALALSRSDKKILHLDHNEFYGGPAAAFTLAEAEAWAAENAAADNGSKKLFHKAIFTKAEGADDVLGAARSYALTLSPQILYCRSELVNQLVSSRAFRSLEFLAVGSFFIYEPGKDGAKPSLVKLPSTREDIFLTTAIPAKAKRGMMKFLKLVMDYDSEENKSIWEPKAGNLLSDFLASTFKLDASLQSFVTALTLSLDGKITVKDGILAISRHMDSMGVFGPGFSAVYPKFGGLSEVIQASCRACAVGGAVYILGTGVNSIKAIDEDGANVEITITSDIAVKTRSFVTDHNTAEGKRVTSKLIAVIDSKPEGIFGAAIEGGQQPAVAIVAFPAKSLCLEQEYPVYAMLHSGETGECPLSQCVAYLSSIAYPASKSILDQALASLLSALSTQDSTPKPLVQLYYEQADGVSSLSIDGSVVTMPCASSDLAFNDDLLGLVQDAWTSLTKGDEKAGEYMKFVDREPVEDDE